MCWEICCCFCFSVVIDVCIYVLFLSVVSVVVCVVVLMLNGVLVVVMVCVRCRFDVMVQLICRLVSLQVLEKVCSIIQERLVFVRVVSLLGMLLLVNLKQVLFSMSSVCGGIVERICLRLLWLSVGLMGLDGDDRKKIIGLCVSMVMIVGMLKFRFGCMVIFLICVLLVSVFILCRLKLGQSVVMKVLG